MALVFGSRVRAAAPAIVCSLLMTMSFAGALRARPRRAATRPRRTCCGVPTSSGFRSLAARSTRRSIETHRPRFTLRGPRGSTARARRSRSCTGRVTLRGMNPNASAYLRFGELMQDEAWQPGTGAAGGAAVVTG